MAGTIAASKCTLNRRASRWSTPQPRRQTSSVPSGGPFVGEAGTFELRAKGVIAMQATVAKNPSAMTKGAGSVFTYRRDGNTLTLTQVRTPAGPNANPVRVTLTRVEEMRR